MNIQRRKNNKIENSIIQSYQAYTQDALLRLASVTTPIILIALAFSSFVDFFTRSAPEYIAIRLPTIALSLFLSVLFLTPLKSLRPKWLMLTYYAMLLLLLFMAYAITIMSWGTAYFYTTPTLLLLVTITIFLGMLGSKTVLLIIYTIPTTIFLSYVLLLAPRILTPILINITAIVGFSIMYFYNEKTRRRMFFADQSLLKNSNKIKKSEESKKMLLDNIKTQVWYLVDSKTFGEVNNSYANFYGKKASDIAFKKITDTFDRKTASKIIKENEQLFREKRAMIIEEWIVNHKGEKRFLSITKTPQLNKRNDVDYIVCSAEDITSHKEFEEKILDSNQDLEKFKLAVDNASDHIIITDSDGFCLYANKAVEKTTGFSNQEILGKKTGTSENWGGLMTQDFYKELWHNIKDKKQSFSGEIKNKRKNGEEYEALASIAPVIDKKGEVVFFVGIERDVTKEKQIDKAKTEFVSLASHQLRTPLTTIAWYLEVLLDGTAGKVTKEQNSHLNEIHNSNQRMIDLVESLLNVSRLELGTFYIEPVNVDIASLLKETVKELSPQIKTKKQKLNQEIENNIDSIKSDKKLLQIVLHNLISNAIKYTPEKGEITISIKNIMRGESAKEEAVKEDSLIITVSDNGYGIPVEEQSKIFDKLFRSRNIKTKEVGGTGLGLYIARSIMERLGGQVWFTSKEGEGTTFFVLLPINSNNY